MRTRDGRIESNHVLPLMCPVVVCKRWPPQALNPERWLASCIPADPLCSTVLWNSLAPNLRGCDRATGQSCDFWVDAWPGYPCV